MRLLDYLDFDVAICREGDRYIARVLQSPGGEAQAEFQIPFTKLETENFLLRIGQPRRITRRMDTPEVNSVKTFGGGLFRALFVPELMACFQRSIAAAEMAEKGLRIRLRLTQAPEVADLPWEYLYYSQLNKFLALSSETPVVRYLDLPERVRSLRTELPLRILVAGASPSDMAALNVAGEMASLKQAVSNLESGGLVIMDQIANATIDALRKKLQSAEYHILHFVGHGVYESQSQGGYLLFEGSAGSSRRLSDQALAILLNEFHSLRLVVLNSCEGARASVVDPYAGVAQSIIQQGIPAVIAMQFEITDEAAVEFAQEFYRFLCEGLPVEAALSQARQSIFLRLENVEWGTPVLYLRAPDGKIFDLVPTSTAPLTPVQRLLPEGKQIKVADRELETTLKYLEAEVAQHPNNLQALSMLDASRRRKQVLQLFDQASAEIKRGAKIEPTTYLNQLKELAPESREYKSLREICNAEYVRTPFAARLTLAYTPVRWWLWIPHVIWYLTLLFIPMAVLAAATTSIHDPDLGSMLGGFAGIIGFGAAANLLANRTDARLVTRRRPIRIVEYMVWVAAIAFTIAVAGYILAWIATGKLTLYPALEGIMFAGLAVVFWSWIKDFRSKPESKPTDNRIGFIILGATLLLALVFGITVFETVKGKWQLYRALTQGLGLGLACLGLRAYSKKRHFTVW